jgi:hypothetical protein
MSSASGFASESNDIAGSVWQSVTDTASKAVDAGSNYIDYADSSRNVQKVGKVLEGMGHGFSAYDAYKSSDNAGQFAIKFAENELMGYAASLVGGAVALITAKPAAGAAASVVAGITFEYAGDMMNAVDKYAEEQTAKVAKYLGEEIYKLYGMSQFVP